MKSTAIERQKLSDRVAALLEDEIVSGERHIGDRLPSEREMMRLFGVGRPTIREALFNLQKKGLVEVSNGARARITQPTPAVILEDISGAAKYLLAQPSGHQHFQEIRAFFETGLARYAANHVDDKDIARLETALKANRRAIGNIADFRATDIEFHFVLAEIPHNPIYPAIHDAMVVWLTDQREITLQVQGQGKIAYDAHKAIFETIVGGNPDKAEKAMAAHLNQLYRVYRQVQIGQISVNGSIEKKN